MPRYKFSESQLKVLLDNLVIICDTREQANSHIIDYFKKYKIKYTEDVKIDYGDYSCFIECNEATKGLISQNIYFDRDIVIERKFCIDELAMNLKATTVTLKEISLEIIELFGKKYLEKILKTDYLRFKDEMANLNRYNIPFNIFIEDKDFFKNLNEGNYRSEYVPSTLKARIKDLEADFHMKIIPIDKAYMGQEIYTTLKYNVRCILKKTGFLEDEIKVGL